MTSVERVLFSVNHPAQVHLFKHAISALESRGIETLVASRRKDVTVPLLEEYGIDHHPLTEDGDGVLSVVAELARRERRLYRLASHFDPDVVVSRLAPPALHVSRALGCRNLVYTDTVLRPWPVRLLYHGLTIPFADGVCAPPGFDLDIDCEQRYTVGFQELAYLHPNRFEPDPQLLRQCGIEPHEPYFVVRLAGWDAYHDVGNEGLSRRRTFDLVDSLAERGDVYITSEEELPPEYEEYQLQIPPHCIHELLYYADLYLGDSQTMPTEAALLGTPAIRINSVAETDEMYNFQKLNEYGLLFSYADGRAAFEKVEEIVSDGRPDEWNEKREALLAQAGDVTAEMVGLILDETAEAQGREFAVNVDGNPTA